MTAQPSAHSVLGLKPGADRETIDKAYRRLIKRYHPDREGGDASRAAEINRAYLELRGRPPQDVVREGPVDIAEAIYVRRAHRQRVYAGKPRRPWKPLLLLGAVAALCAWWPQVRDFSSRVAGELEQATQPTVRFGPAGRAVDGPDALAESLDEIAIDEAINQARRTVRNGKAEAMEGASRSCHRKLRDRPSASLLDRCAAFDFAVVVLSRKDPMGDEGAFSASAVTAREMAAGRLLSTDFLLIDSRLDSVRSRVELSLAERPASPVPQTALTERPARVPD